MTDEDQKLNMAYSSSKKIPQHFETPINLDKSLGRVKKSGVKYIIQEGDQSIKEARKKVDQDAKKKHLQNSMSNSLSNAHNSQEQIN